MEFTFSTEIIETANAVNKAAVVVEKIKNAKVTFSSLKNTTIPGIWATFEEGGKSIFLAALKHADIHEFSSECLTVGNWYIAYPCRPKKSNGHESVVFDYCTNAAYELVQEWITGLTEEYENRLESDSLETIKAA